MIGKTITENTVLHLISWIQTSLEPLESLWVNYLKLYVPGLCGRTTSIGEALHASSKCKFDGVRSSMNITTTANTLMNQAERKGRDTARCNARKIQTTSLWSDSNITSFLTDWAAKFGADQLKLSNLYKVLQMEKNFFLVYIPKTMTNQKKSKFHLIFAYHHCTSNKLYFVLFR